MPEFKDEKHGVAVDTNNPEGGFDILTPGMKKPLRLSREESKALAEQIGYAREYVELYER